MQRHIYSHGWHATATTMPGWEAFLWQHFGRRQVLVLPTRPDADISTLRRFARGFPSAEFLVEVSPALHPRLLYELEAFGWGLAYELPTHVIPVDESFRATLRPIVSMSGGMRDILEVTDAATTADFAWVQEQAYRESYDMPRGCAGLFYADPSALVGPDVVGAVLYDAEDRPVRTAALVRSLGLVSGVAGAAVPRVRGQHLGEAMMDHLLAVAGARFGAEVVYHETMPVAMPIARRLGLAQLTTYYRMGAPVEGVE